MRRRSRTVVAALAVGLLVAAACSSAPAATAPRSAARAADIRTRVGGQGRPPTACTRTCEKLADIADRQRQQPGRRHAGLRRQRGLRRRGVAGQGFRCRDPGVRPARSPHQASRRSSRRRPQLRRRQASLLVTTAPGGLNAVTLQARRGRRLHAGDYGSDRREGRDRRRRRHGLLGRRQAERRHRPRVPSGCSSSATPARTAARRACSPPGTTSS